MMVLRGVDVRGALRASSALSKRAAVASGVKQTRSGVTEMNIVGDGFRGKQKGGTV
jgi:hypothetical protein